MKKNKTLFFFTIILFFLFLILPVNFAYADELGDEINSQIENIDLTGIENFINENVLSPDNFDFFAFLGNVLTGNFSFDYNDVLSFIVKIFYNNIKRLIPLLCSILSVSLICSIIENYKSEYLKNDVFSVIFFVCKIFILIIILTNFINVFSEVKRTLQNISKLCEISTPIVLTLLIGSGGVASGSTIKPAVAFFSNVFISIILNIIMPLIVIKTIFGFLSQLNVKVKLKKFSDFFSSIIKWILGLLTTVFGLFLTVQGITATKYDGITVKALKYSISSSIPIVGGFIKDGFDVISAGSTVIKNAIGLSVIIVLFFLTISPVIKLVSISLTLKLIGAISDTFSNANISAMTDCFCSSITYFISSLLISGVMFFMTILLVILSNGGA